jgi:predicted CxxxxCH...CXXCH cytochrome family protein
VNCHFEKNTTSRTPAPVWGDTAVDCNFCHSSDPAAGPGTANHAKHLTSTAQGATMTCTTCHPNYGTTNFGHASSAEKRKIIVNTGLQYTGGTTKSWLPSQSPAYGACQNVWCHSNGAGTYVNPTWGSNPQAGCTLCHPTLRGKHSVHTNLATAAYGNTGDNSTSVSYDFGCGNCHPTAIGNHLNGTIDLTLNSTHGGVLKSKNNISNDTGGYTQNAGVSVTCAASYCHSNGMATPTFYGATVDWYEVSYSGDKCARCHGNSPNTGGKVGSSAHSAHTVGIHYDDIFNGVSKKLLLSGGQTVNAAHGRNNRSTTINCNICHALTVSSFANDKNTACTGCHEGPATPMGLAAIADKSKHVNGTVEVSFIAQKIATKAQLANSAYIGYTAASAGGWTRHSNGMPFKTATSHYDVTKNTLAFAAGWSQANGCSNVACHANITVKWTDTVSCTSCHTRLK